MRTPLTLALSLAATALLASPAFGQDTGAPPANGATAVPTTTTTTTTASPTSAQTAADTELAASPSVAARAPDDFRSKILEVGARFGVWLPDVFNSMGPHVNPSLEVGVLLPFIEGRLAIVADIGWAPPGASGREFDPRIGASGGVWTYSMTTQELMVSLGPVFRFLPPGSMFVPYVGVFGRLYFLETHVSGTGGANPFGENTEHSMQFGLSGALGGELRLGPGALLLEASLGWADLPHVTTGCSTPTMAPAICGSGATVTSALSIQLGYRIFF